MSDREWKCWVFFMVVCCSMIQAELLGIAYCSGELYQLQWVENHHICCDPEHRPSVSAQFTPCANGWLTQNN